MARDDYPGAPVGPDEGLADDDPSADDGQSRAAWRAVVVAMCDADLDAPSAMTRRNAGRRRRAAQDTLTRVAGEDAVGQMLRALADCGVDLAGIRSAPSELHAIEVDAVCAATALAIEHACTAREASDLYTGERLVRRGQRLLSGALDAEGTRSATYTIDRGISLRDRALDRATARAEAKPKPHPWMVQADPFPARHDEPTEPEEQDDEPSAEPEPEQDDEQDDEPEEHAPPQPRPAPPAPPPQPRQPTEAEAARSRRQAEAAADYIGVPIQFRAGARKVTIGLQVAPPSTPPATPPAVVQPFGAAGVAPPGSAMAATGPRVAAGGPTPAMRALLERMAAPVDRWFPNPDEKEKKK